MNKIDLISKMVTLDPTDGNAWYLLGLEYAQENNISEALKAYSEALKYCDETIKNEIIIAFGNLSTTSNINKDVQEMDYNISDMDLVLEENNNLEEEDVELEGNLIPLKVIEGKRKNKVILEEAKKTGVTFADVGGLDELKETIRMKIIKPFSTPGLFEKFKKKSGGGILLFGPPGCGKTFIAKATSGECNATFIPVHITDILDPFFGVSSRNIRDTFAQARTKKPCVLFFDEIDTIGFNRAKLSGDNMRPVIDQLLVEIEGVDTDNDKMLIIGATNMPWDIDPALKRPGRFDRLIFIMPPDLVARKEIFKLKMADRPSENIDYMELAKKTSMYSGADIENVIELAVENVIDSIMKTGVERKINMPDLLSAIKRTSPSTIEWLNTVETYIRYGNNKGIYADVEQYLKKCKSHLGG